ncbi:MAG TPA: lysophospholipid acyltransferase family protein [Fimbriimonadaceae bacterium]|nr:lysophospholipid acyltransferase family protein [Fimbriimonadaceae bacterium]
MTKHNVAWYRFVNWLVRTVYFGMVTGGLKSVGTENIPKEGAVIIAPVHLSHLDPPATACAMPHRRLRFMAKEELFRGVFGKIIASVGAYPVHRGEGDTEAIRKSIEMLNEGEALLVHPEGTRGDGVRMNPINKGVAMLAKRTGAPIVPVGIVGSNIVMPRGKTKGRRHLITVIFGTPFTYGEVASGGNERESRERFGEILAEKIRNICLECGIELLPPSREEAKTSA